MDWQQRYVAQICKGDGAMAQFRDSWGNLAGLPSRWSSTIGLQGNSRRAYEGFLKLRLGHSEGRSYLVPDVLIAVGGYRFFLPTFFGPPLLSFNIEPGRHFADFNLDVGHPRTTKRERLVVRIRSEDRVRVYDDGAQIYRCTFEGPRALASFASGLCSPDGGGDFLLQLYHHTTPANARNIKSSGELWSSAWNLAGTRKLTNIAYGYFTTLSEIQSEEDLRTIAMASQGTIQFQTTSGRLREEVLSLKVYRDRTRDRTAALAFSVSSELIAPAHLYLHPPVGHEPAYFEVVCPDILRVGVLPKAKLRLSSSQIGVEQLEIKAFDYVIIGDAGTLDGLAAPFDEEETKQITHLEKITLETDLFDFWLANQNTDLVSGRNTDFRQLEKT
ncbi:hypothetical protein [Rhizobium hidalgonense]|uniref:hypothetical protein n=1 Tax=Rhizobium hidalgonense TaxID=1538159 RepID=UPI0011057852|nr:hypothetical protein [Rhizobium hidalgonense]QKK27024.1 hypothetical protein FFM81_027620 [Rhizobium hidalgonense]